MSKKSNKGNGNINIPNPIEQLNNIGGKFKLGEKGLSFYDIKKLKPTFAFDYLSLLQSNLCFDHNTLTNKDYLGFLAGLKQVSEKTYEDLQKERAFRFHNVDFERDKEKITITKNDFLKAIVGRGSGLNENDIPVLYQFDLQYKQEARVFGFLFKGIFYLVWFDRHHQIYKR